MSVLRTARRTKSATHAPCPNYSGQWFHKGTGVCSCGAGHRNVAPIVLRATCETTGCGYRATRTVADRDGLSDRCEGCANEGTVRGWWESVGGAL